MPERYDNTIHKLFFRSKTIIVIPSNITRTGLIIYIKDSEEAFSVDHVYIEMDTKVEGITIADIATIGHPTKSNAIFIINLDAG